LFCRLVETAEIVARGKEFQGRLRAGIKQVHFHTYGCNGSCRRQQAVQETISRGRYYLTTLLLGHLGALLAGLG
jgi:hypothetical protein